MKQPYMHLAIGFVLFFLGGCNPSNETDSSTSSETAKEAMEIIVGTFTNSESKGIYAIDFAPSTGALSNKRLLVETENPSYLYLSKDRSKVYSANGAQRGTTSIFDWNKGKTQLTLVEDHSSEGKGTCFIELNADENLLAVANYASGTIAVYPVGENGLVAGEVQARKHSGSGPFLPNQASAHAHCAKFDASGKFLYIADLGIDKILSYPIDSNGKLGEQKIALQLDPGDGPRHLIFNADGTKAFIINELSNSVVSALVDSETGTFSPIDKKSTLPEDFTGTSYCADIHISPDGKFLYGSNRGHNSIAVFSISEEGSLERIGNESVRGDWPRNFTLSPDGKFLLVANQNSNNITVFTIDSNSGLLNYTGNQITLPEPVCLKFL